MIEEWEPSDRGWYAGPIGWMSADGDGEFTLGLRSALLDGARSFTRAPASSRDPIPTAVGGARPRCGSSPRCCVAEIRSEVEAGAKGAAQTALVNLAWAERLVESLARSGCVTRSSARARSRAASRSLWTARRCARMSRWTSAPGAYFALGLAKASGRPVVVVTTSGTAAANLHPAVVEAHHARVP
jgi:isochorismate synthase EntC